MAHPQFWHSDGFGFGIGGTHCLYQRGYYGMPNLLLVLEDADLAKIHVSRTVSGKQVL